MSKFINSLPKRIVASTKCNAELGDLFTLVYYVQIIASKMYFSDNSLEQTCKAILQMANKRTIDRDVFIHLQRHFPFATIVFAEAFYLGYLIPDEARTDIQEIKLFNAACFEGNVEFFPLLSHVNTLLEEMLDE